MTIGVDLGGSHVLATTVDDSGVIKKRFDIDIEDHAFDAVLRTIVAAVKDVCDQSKQAPAAIGLGSPGNVDPVSGTVRYSPNFGWHDAPLGASLREAFGVPVFIANDARCATLGEHSFGCGVGTANFVLLTLGTGIGGGIIAGGNLLIGNASGAGEFGHHQIRATDGFVCGCGKTGCFEAQASGTGLLRHALALAPSFPRSTLVHRKPEKPSARAVRKAAEAGDGHALAAWQRYIEDLSCGLANIIAFVNPEMIALGGGVSSAGDFMLDAVRPQVEALTTMVPRGTTKIVQASLGNDAGAIGAATMARRGGLVAKATA